MRYGIIHSIETCGTVDGPGLRFVVFTQGCLMRCLYCHNRDTWDMETDKSRKVTVDELMQQVIQYRFYLKATGGGVTASGIHRSLFYGRDTFIKYTYTSSAQVYV